MSTSNTASANSSSKSNKMQPTVDVEIVLRNSSISKKPVIALVKNYLENSASKIRPNTTITQFAEVEHPILHEDIQCIFVGSIKGLELSEDDYINFSIVKIDFIAYSVDTNGPLDQIEEDDGESGEINLATHLVLPSADLLGLWENLFYDNNIKNHLLEYAKTMMEFSDKGINNNIITCNRVVLLHGPPGTGKTSLCKALAQKLTVKMRDRYNDGLLIEINSHSLFSKWFSESGKLVTKLFSKIKEIVQNPNLLVCVLIDEVESLAHARSQCISGNEPSDSIRVVNAVLTQIDQIRRHPNVLLLATSNMTEAIDLAFVDRADIKQYLGLPSQPAIRQVYKSCLEELTKAGIIINSSSPSQEDLSHLEKVCEKSKGMSGRYLRKIPFIAHALYLTETPVELKDFLEAMEKAVEREHKERQYFN